MLSWVARRDAAGLSSKPARCAPRLQLAADVLLGGAVVAGERAHQLGVAVLLDLLQRPAPTRARHGRCRRAALLLLQAGEEVAPFVAHGARVALVLRLHLLDVGGVGALQEGGARKGFVLRLAGHGVCPSCAAGWLGVVAENRTQRSPAPLAMRPRYHIDELQLPGDDARQSGERRSSGLVHGKMFHVKQ